MGYKKIIMVEKDILDDPPGGTVLITRTELQRLYRVIREKETELNILREKNLKLTHFLDRSKLENSSIKF